MTPLLLAVLSASLLGSLHCVSMCGPFVVIAVAPTVNGAPPARQWGLQAAYHLGRLATYAAFGLAAGLLGASLDLGGSLIHVQRAATALAAATLVFFGVVTLLRAVGLRSGARVAPQWMTRLAQRGHRAAWALTPFKRALVIGLLTTLLPCGWLYAFVVTAAGTGHALAGALVMAVFWLGTLPMMVGVGAGFRRIAGPL
ncbi:MAG: sulfite exporter TauE/SafE family protein, partial [Thermoleophilia bacterium]|nr:sulfite exporter TauE/SafE family protein [Thermoleophilia bacterium]